jgi:predicted amidohydrolase
MCHHTFSTVPLEDCPGRMRAGDIYTHTLHGFESTIVQAGTRTIHPSVHAAKASGVLFDIGHGNVRFEMVT